jgi:hypothetical protein
VGLLATDRFAVRAQVLGVIEIDAGDHRAIGVNAVDGIEPPAEAHFQDNQIQRLGRQAQHDGQRGELEIRQLHITARRFDGLEMRQQRFGLHRLAVDPAALLEMHQVRLDVEPDLVAGLQGDSLQHRAGRTLAIGAGNHHDRHIAEFQAQLVAQADHAGERHVDRLRMQALAVGEPFVKCHVDVNSNPNATTAALSTQKYS